MAEADHEAQLRSAHGLASLPSDLLLRIAQYLECRDIVSLICTAKVFAQQLGCELLWKKKMLDDFSESMPYTQASTCSAWRGLYRDCFQLYQLKYMKWTKLLRSAQMPQAVIDLPPAREGHSMVNVHGVIVIFGGFGSGLMKDIWTFDTRRQSSWDLKRATFVNELSRPGVRYGHTMTVCGARKNIIILQGGMLSGGYLAEINQTWRITFATQDQMPPLGQERMQFHAELVDSTSSNNLPLPSAYHAHTTSPSGDRLFIYGGIRGEFSTRTLYSFNLETNEWTSLTRPGLDSDSDSDGRRWPTSRFGASMTFDEKKDELILFGGGIGGDLLRSGYDVVDVDAYNLATGEWRALKVCGEDNLRRGCLGRCHSMVRIKRKVLFFGGGKHTSNGLVAFNLDNYKFEQVQLGGQGRIEPRFTHQCVALEGGRKMLSFGGWTFQRGPIMGLLLFEFLPKPEHNQDEEEGEEEEEDDDDEAEEDDGDYDYYDDEDDEDEEDDDEGYEYFDEYEEVDEVDEVDG